MATVAIVHNHPIHYKHLLFQELHKLGLSFEVLYTAGRSACRIETPAVEAVPYQCRVGHSGSYETHPRWATARFIWRSLDSIAPKVLIITGYSDIAAWTAWVWAGLHRIPRILWAESNYFDHPRVWWKERAKRIFVSRCDAANVYGDSNREYLAWLGMPPDRITTKGAVVNTALFSVNASRPTGRPPHRTVLYVGRFSPEKNVDFLLRAFAAVRQTQGAPKLVLALVGYGPLESHLRSFAARLRLGDTVRFLGPATQSELPEIYRSAHALVLPSLHETWGLVVLEAMACGLPVLVSDRCGCAHDVVNAASGWTFSPNDLRQLTALLQQVASLPLATLESMGQSAARIASTYSPERCARLVIQSLQEVLHTPALQPNHGRLTPGLSSPDPGQRAR